MISRRLLDLMTEDEWNLVMNKYSDEDLFVRSNKLITKFYIPPEIILSEYRTSRTLINKENGWASTHINRIVTTVTNGILTSKDYVDIFMYKILDGIGPKCSNCGKPLSFTGSISNPYYRYCSRSCGTSSMNYRLWSSDNSPFRTDEYKLLKSEIAKNLSSSGLIGLGSKNCSLGNSLSIYSKYDYLYFYIIYDNIKVKIGISHTENASDRIYRMCLYNFDKYNSTIKVYKGTSHDIILLENDIKFNEFMVSNRYTNTGEGWQELFNISSLNFIFNFINNYKSINLCTD